MSRTSRTGCCVICGDDPTEIEARSAGGGSALLDIHLRCRCGHAWTRSDVTIEQYRDAIEWLMAEPGSIPARLRGPRAPRNRVSEATIDAVLADANAFNASADSVVRRLQRAVEGLRSERTLLIENLKVHTTYASRAEEEVRQLRQRLSTLVFPHCDPRVLHRPGECQYCDESGLQKIRDAWGLCFTGAPERGKLPCPADLARGDQHEAWPGNRPSPTEKR